jgi:asparagine synthase (glutamine-hydrolysing)
MEGGSRLATALRSAAARCAASAPAVTVLFSGGLDSSLVAFLLKPFVPVRLLVIGVDGSKDPGSAREAASLLGLPLREALVTSRDLTATRDRFAAEIAGLPETLRSVNLALAVALDRSDEPVVAVGQGADELFYGYAHFRGLPAPEARARSRRDWDLLLNQEWPRAVRIAERLGREIRSPYLDPRVIALAQELEPPGPADPPKAELRRAARELGLPDALAAAPKRALQYGSGVERLLRRIDAAR